MAAKRKEQTDAIFLKIIGGHLVQTFKEATEETTLLVVENDKSEKKTYNVIKYSSLEGFLVTITYVKNDVGGQKWNEWRICLKDDLGERVYLSLSEKSNAFRNFAKMLPNIDLSMSVDIFVGKDKQTKHPVLFAKQDSYFIKSSFTKDDPKDLPKAKQKKNGDWDFTDHDEFLYNLMLEYSEILKINKEHESENIQ